VQSTSTKKTPVSNLILDLNSILFSNSYVVDTGSVNSVVLNFPASTVITSLSAGVFLKFKLAYQNTGAVTLQVKSNGTNVDAAYPVVNSYGNALISGQIKSNLIYCVVFSGTNWIVVGLSPAAEILPSYTGNALKTLRVNSSATGIEWATTDTSLAQVVVSSNYTLVLSDANKQIFHPSSDTTSRNITIPSNASVPFPIGTTITIINESSAGSLVIGITSDTLQRIQSASSAPFTLSANGMATAVKVTATKWVINGVGFA
jgi:hypothetical protein